MAAGIIWGGNDERERVSLNIYYWLRQGRIFGLCGYGREEMGKICILIYKKANKLCQILTDINV